MKNLYLMLLVVLVGCASAQQVKGPNGADAYLVKCGNLAKDKCTEKANDLCPHGYNSLDRNANPYDDMTKVGNLGVLEIKADTTTTIMIQCK